MNTDNEKELYKILQQEGIWDAARLLGARFFPTPGDKFVTEFRYVHHWIVVQWVTTSSSTLSGVPRVFPGRVGIALRRKIAFRRMVEGRWLLDEPEPGGFTVAVRFFPRLGKWE